MKSTETQSRTAPCEHTLRQSWLMLCFCSHTKRPHFPKSQLFTRSFQSLVLISSMRKENTPSCSLNTRQSPLSPPSPILSMRSSRSSIASNRPPGSSLNHVSSICTHRARVAMCSLPRSEILLWKRCSGWWSWAELDEGDDFGLGFLVFT